MDGLLLGGALAPTAASAGALRHLAPDGALSHFTRGVVAVCGADQPSEAYLCHQLRALLARTHECREFAHCAFAAFVPLAWLEASAPAAAPCVHPLPRAPPFGACGRVHEGFMPQGNDELTAEMSLQEAVEYCHASRECRGFTYRASEALPAGKLKIWFKTTRRVKVKPGCGWFAYIAGFPADDAREAAEAAASASALAKKGSLSSLLHGHGFGGGQGGPPSKRQHAEHPAAPGRPARGKYLVFTSAGDSSFLDKWFRPPAGAAAVERTWDCCIVYYGSQKRRWAEYADMYIENKGGKFENLLHVYKTHANFIHKYDAVMVLDDDVGIDAAGEGARARARPSRRVRPADRPHFLLVRARARRAEPCGGCARPHADASPRCGRPAAGINRCFELREQFDLWLLQPAFDPAGKISHTVTRLQVGPSLRYTNFIEMTCPLFEKQALDRFMNVFDPSLKGWGADWWFLQVHAQRARVRAHAPRAAGTHGANLIPPPGASAPVRSTIARRHSSTARLRWPTPCLASTLTTPQSQVGAVRRAARPRRAAGRCGADLTARAVRAMTHRATQGKCARSPSCRDAMTEYACGKA